VGGLCLSPFFSFTSAYPRGRWARRHVGRAFDGDETRARRLPQPNWARKAAGRARDARDQENYGEAWVVCALRYSGEPNYSKQTVCHTPNRDVRGPIAAAPADYAPHERRAPTTDCRSRWWRPAGRTVTGWSGAAPATASSGKRNREPSIAAAGCRAHPPIIVCAMPLHDLVSRAVAPTIMGSKTGGLR